MNLTGMLLVLVRIKVSVPYPSALVNGAMGEQVDPCHSRVAELVAKPGTVVSAADQRHCCYLLLPGAVIRYHPQQQAHVCWRRREVATLRFG